MKSHIKIFTLDVFDTWQAIKPAIINQLKELNHLRVPQQVRVPLDISGVLFETIRDWVSHQASLKVQEQQRLLSALKAPCSQTFTSSRGLPCAHTLRKLEEEKQALLLEHFLPHWHLKRNIAQPQLMLEPRAASRQRNERRNQPITSTRRERSAFEAVEVVARPKAQSKCSRCHTLGHKMTSKAYPLRHEELLQSSAAPTQAAPAASSEPSEPPV